MGSFLGVLPASIPFAYAGAITKTYSSGVVRSPLHRDLPMHTTWRKDSYAGVPACARESAQNASLPSPPPPQSENGGKLKAVMTVLGLVVRPLARKHCFPARAEGPEKIKE